MLTKLFTALACTTTALHGSGPTPKASLFEEVFQARSHNFDLSDYGKPDLPAGRITFVNGAWTTKEMVLGYALETSELIGGFNIHNTYNASHGAIDLIEAVINLRGEATEPVACLHEQWDSYFLNDTTGAPLLHECHSQGAAITRVALELYSKEFRKRIIVRAYAPFAYISKELCQDVLHYVNDCDFIPSIDLSGRERACKEGTLVLIPQSTLIPFDHSFDSPTYTRFRKTELLDYLDLVLNHA